MPLGFYVSILGNPEDIYNLHGKNPVFQEELEDAKCCLLEMTWLLHGSYLFKT